MQTFVFAWNGSTLEHIELPAVEKDYHNPWIVPEKWSRRITLALRITGPHAGKARGSGYSGLAVVQIDPARKTATTTNEQIQNGN